MTHIDPVMYLGAHPDGAGWYYFDETWSFTYGPYEDELKARHALLHYDSEINSVDPHDFWSEQFEEARVGEVIHPIPTQEQMEAAWNVSFEIKPTKRLPLKTIPDLFSLEGLIDGGYLSFVYGSRPSYGSWHIVKMKYSNYLMLLDSAGVRQREYPLYKSKRQERRQQYDYMQETYERVKKFRIILKNDPMVYTAMVDGYEADDLIAILFLKGIGKERVIAQDKDFFMIKGLREVMIDHAGVPQSYRDLKLPKYAIPPGKPATWALTQAIFGDRSDTIPRLLPSKSGYRGLYAQLIRQAPNLLSAFWNCYAEFGDQFVTNLRLVLLPHPTLSTVDYDDLPNLLFEDLSTGEYWNPDSFDDGILLEILNSVEDMEWI